MDAQQFAYWLQGFAELNEAQPTAEQWKSIREHLGTVFVKVTPPLSGWKPGQIGYPQLPSDASRMLRPVIAECRGGTVLASGDGDTSLC